MHRSKMLLSRADLRVAEKRRLADTRERSLETEGELGVGTTNKVGGRTERHPSRTQRS